MGSKVRTTTMRSALVLIVSASLAVGQQQGVGPASTIQLQPGQFSVFGQPRQQPVNIPGTQGQVVAQFIDEQGQSIPIQQLGQPQQQQFQPQQQQFQPQQQRFQPAPQQQQQFRPAPQQQFRPAPAQPQQQQFRPAPQQQQPAAGSFRATANQQDAHRGHIQVHQQNLAIQQQQFSPEQRQALREFQANPPPPRAQPQQAAPQPQRSQPAPQPQRQRPAPQQPQRFAPAPQQQQQFSQFPARGVPQQQRRPAEAPRRAQAQAPRRQQEPGSVNDALGQQIVAAENYVHDTTGDATLSRFQQFQLRKKQEAQGAIAPQA